MLLINFFETCYLPLRLHGKSANTSRLYRISIRSFSTTLGRPAHIEDLTDEAVKRHLQRVLDAGRSKATANKDRSQLLAIWRFAHQHGYVAKWPCVPAEIEPVRIPRAWMAEDVRTLFAAVDRLEGDIDGVDRRIWWRCLLMVCLETGERIGALMQAEWSWIDRSWMVVPAEARKGGRRDKQYLLGTGTLARLADLRRQSPIKLFPWPYNQDYLWQKYAEILKLAGLPHGRRDKFHRLRRTCASVIHAAGLDATEALDHAHRRTTQAYLDPRFTRQDQPSKIIADWLRNPRTPKKRDAG